MEIAYKNLNSDNIIALDIISSQIKNAIKAVDTHVIAGTTYTTDFDTLVLELPSVDASQNIITGKYDYQVFYRDPADQSKLKSAVELGAGSSRAGSPQVLNTNLQTINFNYNNQSLDSVSRIEVIISSETSVQHKNLVLGAQTTAKLRNK
jgi:hypothetical protein